MKQKTIKIIRFIPVVNLFMFFIMAFSPLFINVTKRRYYLMLGFLLIGSIPSGILNLIFSCINNDIIYNILSYINLYLIGIIYSSIAIWYFKEEDKTNL